ncbi:MAG: ABC transporter substrate-binding protein [Planctomycetaceae bacterium]|nr:MAG: ABC transporter substrate-binding protein [Planctomycetaceae bacterium]
MSSAGSDPQPTGAFMRATRQTSSAELVDTQATSSPIQPDSGRRHFLEWLTWGTAGLMAGSSLGCGEAQPLPQEAASGLRPLRACFSNAGLQSTWCALGKKTAELWGRMLNVEIEWVDGEFNPEKQRNKIEAIVHRDWDFCCFQAVQIDTLAEPVRRLKERNIPVISMDTLLVDLERMRDVGVWCLVAPDHEQMAELSVGYLMQQIGGRGKVIHIGGLSAHSGAQGRRIGFERVVSRYPDVQVVGGGVRWCDWKKEKARDTFEAILQQEQEPIAGAFFHSDDMALACVDAIRGTIHEQMVICAVDGQRDGLDAVRDGRLAATAVNPVCRIHRTALFLGQFIARNQESLDQVPLEVITPGPLVTRDNPRVLQAMYYLADEKHGLV